MFDWLIKFIPLSIIGVMVRNKRILTPKEAEIQKDFLKKLVIEPHTDQLVIGIIGLVGSGKSSVAQHLAMSIDATVIENDAIRIELRKQGESYDRVWAIAENLCVKVLERGGNIILDSDFADEKKRASLREKVRKFGVRLVFIRTHCDFDVASQRIRENDPGEFFNNATSLSTSSEKGKDVKMRELNRRMPLHYRWVNKAGGKWVLKKFPFAIFAEIDTTYYSSLWDESLREDVWRCAKKLLAK